MWTGKPEGVAAPFASGKLIVSAIPGLQASEEAHVLEDGSRFACALPLRILMTTDTDLSPALNLIVTHKRKETLKEASLAPHRQGLVAREGLQGKLHSKSFVFF